MRTLSAKKGRREIGLQMSLTLMIAEPIQICRRVQAIRQRVSVSEFWFLLYFGLGAINTSIRLF
ncbi:hypothetical protein Ciccas_001968 [Cichlidogyrus casuarinus]|uniref:Uncharacterized protein n=1 Tax=Cichlidogyrus casuarinus TaxID=1844966 RepID=A0ABD2QIM8_9PLAT